jgi:hypothetical protein
MLGTIAVVSIAVWLPGFFESHVTIGFIQISLVVGLLLLVFRLLRSITTMAYKGGRFGEDLAEPRVVWQRALLVPNAKNTPAA